LPRRSTPNTFRLDLGHPALNFMATLAGRLREPQEKLVDPEALHSFLSASGLATRPGPTARDVSEAKRLREAIHALVSAAVGGDAPPSEALGLVNAWALRPPLAPQLRRDGAVGWAGERPIRAALAALARETVLLLGGVERGRIRKCAHPTCSLYYLDRSRSGRRRWCSMTRCGNRVKTARYRTGRTMQER
jgi:predicted RNA-binding Zn ribbon-like protein